MKKKVAKKASGKVPMKTVGNSTTGVVNYGPGYKGPQLEKSATGRPAPAMKKGGSVKSKK
jgi:hypothetical protein